MRALKYRATGRAAVYCAAQGEVGREAGGGSGKRFEVWASIDRDTYTRRGGLYVALVQRVSIPLIRGSKSS